MSKLITLLTITMMAATAQAEIFYCDFNEPAVRIALDTETGMIKWTDANRSEFATQVDTVVVNEHAVGAAFWRGNNFYRLALDLTTFGTIARSTYTYPVRGELLDYWIDEFGFYRSLVGGCFSAERPKVCLYTDCY